MEVNFTKPEPKIQNPLLEILSAPTERKEIHQEQDFIQEPDTPADFTPEPEPPKPAQEPTASAGDAPGGSPAAEKTQYEAKPAEYYRDQAKNVVKTLDHLGVMFLPRAIKNKLLLPGDADQGPAILERVKKSGIQSLSEKELSVFNRFSEYEEYVKGLPLLPEEKAVLIEDIGEIMQIYARSFSPQNRLATTLISTFGIRLLPLILA